VERKGKTVSDFKEEVGRKKKRGLSEGTKKSPSTESVTENLTEPRKKKTEGGC